MEQEERQTAEAPERTRRLSGRRATALGILVFLALAYAAVNVLYWRSTQTESPLVGIPDEEATGRMVVALDFTSLSTQESSITLDLKAAPTPELVDEDGFLKEKLEIILLQIDADVERTARALPIEAATVTFNSGALLLTREVKLRPSGHREDYPFDRYEGYVSVAAVASGEGRRQEVPTLLVVGGDAPGWNVTSERGVEHPAESQGDVTADEPFVKYEITRAGSTVTIVVLILVALIIMILCAAWVSRSVLVKRRRIEATMASWFAALLFAVIPLRLNMPGAPPMGVWMDFLVVLWVEVGLMIALAVFIYSWLSYTPRPDYAPAEPPRKKPPEPAPEARRPDRLVQE